MWYLIATLDTFFISHNSFFDQVQTSPNYQHIATLRREMRMKKIVSKVRQSDVSTVVSCFKDIHCRS